MNSYGGNRDFYQGSSSYQVKGHSLGVSAGTHKLLKNFYVEDKVIAAATPEQVKEFRLRNNNIMIFPPNPSVVVPNPCTSFKQAFCCDHEILRAIECQNFTQPSPIQCQVWPVLLSGHDCISISQTGSGKTLGFLLPGFVHSHMQTDNALKDPNKPGILVICPTRELAIQTHQEVLKYAYRGYRTTCVYGGASKGPQISSLRNGAKIVVGTPGRINDLINAGCLDVSRVTYMVLDEADRMLDMGFEPQIRQILEKLPTDRQNVMTSATWPKEVHALAEEYTNNAIRIQIGKIDLHAAETIMQVIECGCMDQYQKEDHLLNFMRQDQMRGEKILIFTNTKMSAMNLCRRLRQSGINADTIHGNLVQSEREHALNNFRRNVVTAMTATDVAARGLDLPDIKYVVNFDMPNNIDEYVHRIGRTGRAGKLGTAITYFTPQDANMAKKLIKVLTEANQKIDPRLYQYQNSAPSKSSYGSRNSFRDPRDSNGGFQKFGNSRGNDRFGSGGGYSGGFKREKNDYNRY